MAMETILSGLSISMTEFKKNPNEALRESGGQTVAVLSHNKARVLHGAPRALRSHAGSDRRLAPRARGKGTPQTKRPSHRGNAG